MFFKKYKALKKENEELKNKIKELEEKNSLFIIREDKRRTMKCTTTIQIPYWEDERLMRVYKVQPEEIREKHLRELKDKMMQNISRGLDTVMEVRESPYVNPIEMTVGLEGTVYFLSKE